MRSNIICPPSVSIELRRATVVKQTRLFPCLFTLLLGLNLFLLDLMNHDLVEVLLGSTGVASRPIVRKGTAN
jgi:hypothetical protein